MVSATLEDNKNKAQAALHDHAGTCTECTKSDRCKAGRTLLADLFKSLDAAHGRPTK